MSANVTRFKQIVFRNTNLDHKIYITDAKLETRIVLKELENSFGEADK